MASEATAASSNLAEEAMKFQDIIIDTVAYYPNFIESELATQYLKVLRDTVPWKQEHMTFGVDHKVPLPRLTSWHGDPDARYYYSGIHNDPKPWTPELLALRLKCDELFGPGHFNSVLANYYRDGNDSISYHVDNERDLVDNSVIATISLGTPRRFQLKSKSGSGEVKEIKIEHGSLLLMYGLCQKQWLHGIPKERDIELPRISLTFRTVRLT